MPKPSFKAQEDEVLSYWLAQFAAAEMDRRKREDRWIELLKEYRLYKDPEMVKRAREKGRSAMRLARAYQYVHTKLPRWFVTTFASDKWVQALPRTQEQEEWADENTDLINWQMQVSGFKGTCLSWMQDAIVLGTSVLMDAWEIEEALFPRELPLPDYIAQGFEPNERVLGIALDAYNAALTAQGLPEVKELPPLTEIPPEILQVIRIPVEVPEVVYQGPKSHYLDLFDVWFDPAARSPQLDGCQFVFRRIWRTKEQLRQVNEARKRQGLPPLYTNLEKLKDIEGSDRWTWESGQGIRASALGKSINPGEERPLEILEVYVDGNECYAIAERKVLIKRYRDPAWSGRLKDKFHVLCHDPQPGEVYGVALHDWIMDPLRASEGLYNDVQDNVGLVTNPPLFVDEMSLVDPRDAYNIHKNKVIRVQRGMNEPVSNVLYQMQFAADFITSGHVQLGVLDRTMEEITGLHRNIQGERPQPRVPYSAEATALNEANLRLQLDLHYIADAIVKVAESYNQMNARLLPEEYPIQLFGEDGAPFIKVIRREAAQHLFRFRMVSVSLDPLANKQVQSQNLIQFLQTFQGIIGGLSQVNPQLAQQLAMQVDWLALAEATLEKFEFRPGRRIFTRMTPAQQLQALLPAALQDPQGQQVVAQAAVQTPQGQQMLLQLAEQLHQQMMRAGQMGAAPQQSGGGAASVPGAPQPPGAEDPETEAAAENERLLMGEPVEVEATDDHQVHLAMHQQAEEVAMAEGLPTLANIRKHIQDHTAHLQGGMNGAAEVGPFPQGGQ